MIGILNFMSEDQPPPKLWDRPPIILIKTKQTSITIRQISMY